MPKPFFSIIMASTLSNYKGCATNREMKIVRAIESVIAQSFGLWELIVVADDCQKTFDIIKEKYSDDSRINCFLMPKQIGTVWANVNVCRNFGRGQASGEYNLYLDNDDAFGTDHLHKVHEGLLSKNYPNVVFFDDMLSQPDRSKDPIKRKCRLIRGSCGTSNIAFHKSIGVSWSDSTYLHDWKFIQSLMKYGIVEIPPCEYIVCHIPHPQKPLDV